MLDALVADGDLVILEPASDARNGEMVAAWLDGNEETTLKRFYIEGDMVRLQPENPAMEPILTEADNLEIQGRVVSILRQPN